MNFISAKIEHERFARLDCGFYGVCAPRAYRRHSDFVFSNTPRVCKYNKEWESAHSYRKIDGSWKNARLGVKKARTIGGLRLSRR